MSDYEEKKFLAGALLYHFGNQLEEQIVERAKQLAPSMGKSITKWSAPARREAMAWRTQALDMMDMKNRFPKEEPHCSTAQIEILRVMCSVLQEYDIVKLIMES